MYPSHVVAYRSIASGNRSALLHGGVNGNRGSEESSPEPRASGMTSVIKVLLVCVSCGAVITDGISANEVRFQAVTSNAGPCNLAFGRELA